MNGAKGNMDGKVIAPSGTEDDAFLSKIDDDQWAFRFIPRENGVHRLHIRFNGVHIPESPFSMRIGRDDADPAAVHVSGQGIKEVIYNNFFVYNLKKLKIFITKTVG